MELPAGGEMLEFAGLGRLCYTGVRRHEQGDTAGLPRHSQAVGGTQAKRGYRRGLNARSGGCERDGSGLDGRFHFLPTAIGAFASN